MKRRMFAAMCLPLMLLAPLAGQETKKDEKPAPAAQPRVETVTRIYELKNQNTDAIYPLLRAFGVQIEISRQLNAITVTGRPDAVTAVAEAIMRFDVPAKNIELTAYIMAGLAEAASSDSAPKILDSVIKELRALFAYQSYRVLDTLILRTREGLRANASGTVAAMTGNRLPIPLSVEFTSAAVSPDAKGNLVRLEGLRLNARMGTYETTGRTADGKPTTGVTYRDSGFNTNIDIREGQKVVVGKANVDGSNALILVVMAKVVD